MTITECPPPESTYISNSFRNITPVVTHCSARDQKLLQFGDDLKLLTSLEGSLLRWLYTLLFTPPSSTLSIHCRVCDSSFFWRLNAPGSIADHVEHLLSYWLESVTSLPLSKSPQTRLPWSIPAPCFVIDVSKHLMHACYSPYCSQT